MINTHETYARYRAVLFLILTAALWSTSGLLIKLLTWEPLAILSGRSIVAGIVIWLSLRRGDPHLPHFTRWQVVGALSYVGTQLMFITATKLTTAANAIFLQYTALWVFLVIGEAPGQLALAGAALVVLALTGRAWVSARNS